MSIVNLHYYFVYLLLNRAYAHDTMKNSTEGGKQMAIRYKAGILDALKAKGYTAYRIRKERIFGEQTLQDIRSREAIQNKTLDRLCNILDCGIGDIIEYVPDDNITKSQH